jgi:AhpC/TSA family
VKALPQSLAFAVVAVAALGCPAKQDGVRHQAEVAIPVASQAPASRWNPTFTDIEGQTHRPCDEPNVKAVALVFILTDCPIANSYIPALNRLHAAFEPRGVRLFLVHADASVTAEQAREHARQYEIRAPVILDPQHVWVKQAGATRTPEAVVFSPAEEVLYRGRIDDQYVGVGQRRTQVTSHDLEEALSAILAGKPVPQPITEAVGCFIPELPRGE